MLGEPCLRSPPLSQRGRKDFKLVSTFCEFYNELERTMWARTVSFENFQFVMSCGQPYVTRTMMFHFTFTFS